MNRITRYIRLISYVTLCVIATTGLSIYAQTNKDKQAKPVASSAMDMNDIRNAIADYDLDKAEELINKVETLNRRNKKKNPLPAGLESAKDEISKIREMLDRVESIEIIDSLTVPKEEAYKYIPLTPAAGRYIAPTVLPDVFPRKDASVVYATEDYSMIMWGARNSNGKMTIYQSDRLSDGRYAAPLEIAGDFGDTDIDYPYLSSDGVTLYFASKNPDGLGGYDIYMTRRENNSFLLPQSLGMPYNSSADDYLFIIDDIKNIGWWMTDRKAPEGKVTIYTFIPQELRKNYSPETPGLSSLAQVKYYKASWSKDKDYAPIISNARQKPVESKPKENLFQLYIPGHGVYESISEFKSSQAQELMDDYIKLTEQYASVEKELAMMRRAYSSGNTDVSGRILQYESDLQTLRNDIKMLGNEIVRCEQSIN